MDFLFYCALWLDCILDISRSHLSCICMIRVCGLLFYFFLKGRALGVAHFLLCPVPLPRPGTPQALDGCVLNELLALELQLWPQFLPVGMLVPVLYLFQDFVRLQRTRDWFAAWNLEVLRQRHLLDSEKAELASFPGTGRLSSTWAPGPPRLRPPQTTPTAVT